MGKPLPLYLDPNLKIIYLITLIAVLGVASITPAFPKVAQQFDISSQSIGLLIIAFTLPGVILTPVLGVFADRIGRKKVLLPSLFIFGIAGFACSLANSFELLLVFRFIQGAGAASLGSLNVTLIGDLFSGKERASAMGYNASVLSTATAVYPFIGGVLASFHWRFVFYIPVLSIPIAFLVLFKLSNPEPKNTQQLKSYLKNAFNTIKDKNAVILFAASIITFIILYGSYLTYIPIFLHNRFAAEPFIIGLMMSVMSVVTAIISSQLGKLTAKFGHKKLLIISFIFYSISLLILIFINRIELVVISMIIYGFGQGLNIPSIQTLLTSIASLEYRAAFMSMNGMVLRVGQTLGPLVMGLFFMIGNISAVFLAGSLLALLMILPLLKLKLH